MPIRYQSEIIDKIFDSSNNSVRTSLVTVDVQIGAVEIKDGTTDARAAVNSANALAVAAIGNLTLSDSKGFIGLVTVGNTVATTFSGNITLDAGSRTAIAGNVTLSDSKGYIGLVTVGNTVTTTFSGNITLDAGSRTGIAGNLTLSDSKGYIGLVTIGHTPNVAVVGNVTLSDSKGFIGLVTVGNTPNVAVVGNVTLSDAKTNIGLVTLTGGTAWTDPKTYIGLVTIGHTPNVAVVGNVTLSDAKGYIGLVTIGHTPNVAVVGNVTLSDAKTYIGLVTIGGSSLITLGDPKGFIGLVTTVPTYMSGYTSLATVISATGVATLVIPPAGQKIFVRNMHVASLGRAEISAWRVNSGTATTAVIPWTALATTGGFVEFMGENGQQWGLADDGLTFALNGGATVGVKVDVRFA